MKKESFFSKSYLYPSIWAIIIGLLGFTSGHFWQKWSGPDKVYVMNKSLNNESNKDTTVTIIHFQPDEKYFENLAKLTQKDFQKTYPKKSTETNSKRNLDSMSLLIAKEYQSKFDSIRISLPKVDPQKLNLNDTLVSKSNGTETKNVSQVKRPKFKLPPTFKGYSEKKVNSYATINLNSSVFNKREKVEVSLDFFDKNIVSKITPLFVEIVEVKSENSYYYIWGEQYELREKKNVLTFSADFKTGKYKLTIGFYFLDEINKKYPEYYCKKYDIEIK